MVRLVRVPSVSSGLTRPFRVNCVHYPQFDLSTVWLVRLGDFFPDRSHFTHTPVDKTSYVLLFRLLGPVFFSVPNETGVWTTYTGVESQRDPIRDLSESDYFGVNRESQVEPYSDGRWVFQEVVEHDVCQKTRHPETRYQVTNVPHPLYCVTSSYTRNLSLS